MSFAVHHIGDFILDYVKPGASLLDVGAGRGQIATKLATAGISVTAIDRSDKAIELARANGIEVQRADIVTFETASNFDAVLLSMVAHHIHPLPIALDRIAATLKPGGTVIIEDFAVEDADAATAAWYYQTLASLQAVDLVAHGNIPLRAIEEPLDAWWRDHSDDHHPFNRGQDIVSLIRERFEIRSVARGPYFYRYLAGTVQERTGRDHGAELHALEGRLAQAGRIKLLGLRIVASRR